MIITVAHLLHQPVEIRLEIFEILVERSQIEIVYDHEVAFRGADDHL